MAKSESQPMLIASRVYRTEKGVLVVATVEDETGRKVVSLDMGENADRILKPSHILAALAQSPGKGIGSN